MWLDIPSNILNRPIREKEGQNKGNKPDGPKAVILDEEGGKNSSSHKAPNQRSHKERLPEKLHLPLPYKISICDHGLLEIPCHKRMVVGVIIYFSKGSGYNPQAQSKERHNQNIGHFFGKNPATKVVKTKGTKVLSRQTEWLKKRWKTVIKKIPIIKANMVASLTSTSAILWPIKPTDRKTTFPVWPAAKVPPLSIKV